MGREVMARITMLADSCIFLTRGTWNEVRKLEAFNHV